jgi:hypothetical protein
MTQEEPAGHGGDGCGITEQRGDGEAVILTGGGGIAREVTR